MIQDTKKIDSIFHEFETVDGDGQRLLCELARRLPEASFALFADGRLLHGSQPWAIISPSKIERLKAQLVEKGDWIFWEGIHVRHVWSLDGLLLSRFQTEMAEFGRRMADATVDLFEFDKQANARIEQISCETVQLNREIEVLEQKFQEILEDNHHQYEIIQKQQERYSEKLESEIRRQTGEIRRVNQALVRKSQRLEALRKVAESANQAKSEFLATMSHEIRTPLNAIVGMNHLLKRTGLSEKQLDYLNKSESASRGLLAIINEILDFSKIEARKLELESIPFDLVTVVKQSADILSHKAAEKKLSFDVDIDPRVPTRLIGDPQRLGQILINLLSNAVKFTRSGRIELRAAVISGAEDVMELKFAVQDTGIGIPEKAKECLFKPFSQVDGSTTRNYGGTGLGLAICKQLVELMNGRIWVESRPGIGSTFYFTVRFFIPKNADRFDRSACEAKEPKCHGVANGLHGKRILLVDDNKLNRMIANEMLAFSGASVTEACNGKEAVEMVRNSERPFDAVLMDVEMPILDGYAATRQIREKPGCAQLPIIAMTAHAMECHRQESLNAGMNAHLTKPIDPVRLEMVLDGVLCGVRQADAAKSACEKSSSIDNSFPPNPFFY